MASKLRPKGDRTKGIPPRYAAPFRSRFERWVAEHYQGNQTRAADALGMSQAHVSDLLGGRRSLGLSVLLELYEQTGITPNDWLGIRPKQPAPEPDRELVSAVLSGVADLLAGQRREDSQPPQEPPPSVPNGRHHDE